MERIGKRLLALITAAGIAGVACPSVAADAGRWTYSGATGPAKWAKLEKNFAACAQGRTQSPIDIPDAEARKGDLPPLLFDYRTSPLTIVDNGHTIQINYAPGSSISVEGKHYELVGFDFHKPSEEKISGKGHDMDVHLMHRSKDGKLAVVAVLLDEGKENALVKTLWGHWPQTKDKETTVDAVKINALELLPRDKGYYTFAGSLTTPPCTEDVKWIVLKTPVQISADEIARFAKTYPMNARPVQELNGRDIQATR
ncbi:MAG TPA: carbonic anhydrase family protein [Casimicrobiaceae bacterium]|jgi:carbonic anhydrase